jgi:hypothetical protein
MYQTVKGEYGDSVVWVEKPEPPRADSRANRIRRSEVLKQEGWTAEQLQLAKQYGHPDAIGGFEHSVGNVEPVYSRSARAAWREQILADLRALGFQVK